MARRILLLVTGLLLLSGPAGPGLVGAQETSRPRPPRRMEGAVHPGPAAPSRAATVPVTDLADAAVRIDLGPAEPPPARPPGPDDGMPAPVRVGFERAVPATDAQVSGASAWRALPDGRSLTTLAVTSPGAVGLRVSIAVEAAPIGTLLLVHAPGRPDPTVEPLEVRAAADAPIPGRRAAARRERARSRPMWSAIVEGDTALVDVVVPARGDLAAVGIRLARVAHQFAPPQPGGSLACNRDIECAKKWTSSADAVAHYVFQKNGSSYICTGTVLNTASGAPYFLTAAHCVASQSVASTLTLYWFYERTTCKSSTYRYQQTVGGGLYLASTGGPELNGSPDSTLLRLNNSPAAGTYRSGWWAKSWGNVPIVGIHHPAGDIKKLSTGRILGTGAWVPGNQSAHYYVVWQRGTTQGGSSGSGLFTGKRFPDQYLIAVLSGGPEAKCIPGVDSDYYGRLELAYSRFKKYLK